MKHRAYRIGGAVVCGMLLAYLALLLILSLSRSGATPQQSRTVTPSMNQAQTPVPAVAFTGEPIDALQGNLPLLDAATTLSRTLNGYTLSIGPLPEYTRIADATVIFLPYTVTNWQGKAYTEATARLAERNGQGGPIMVAGGVTTLTWLGTTTQYQNVPGTVASRPGYSVMVFDATSLTPGQAEHTLQLTINLRITDTYEPWPGATGKSPSGSATPNEVLVGPFLLSFRLPFDPVHSTADVNQTITAGNVPVTLEKVIASVYEARVVLSFASPDGGPLRGWQPTDMLLSGDGIERSVVSPLGGSSGSQPVIYSRQVSGWLNDQTWQGSALNYLGSGDFRQGGKWRLVVGALENSGNESGWLRRIEGPWTFDFTMPPFGPLPTPPPGTEPQNTSVPGLTAPPTQPVEATHEPFPTVPLPGPIETATSYVINPPPPTKVRPPLPIETAQAVETMVAAYPTVVAAVSATRVAQPTPPGTGDTRPQLRNIRKLPLHPDLETANLNSLNPPALSPQGDALLVSTRDHRLLLARLDGSPPLELASEVSQYAWSADGRYVVYLHMEPMGVPTYIQVPYSVTPDGQARHRLSFESHVTSIPDVGAENTWEMRWTQRPGIWRVPLDGGPAAFVVSVPGAEPGYEFKVAPDGKRIAYICKGGVCLQDIDGSNWRKLPTQPYRVFWSRDNSMLAVLTMHNILFYSRDGTMKSSPQYSEIPLEGISGISQGSITLEWTADSRYLLVYLGMLAYQGRHSLAEMDTVTGYTWGSLAPEWAKSFSISPDGKQLILRGEAAEFWIADLIANKTTTPQP